MITAMTVGAAARQWWSPATATTLMPAIDIGTLFIGWEDREDNGGGGVAMEDDDNADVEAGEYACNFLEGVLRQLWEGSFRRRRRRTTTKMTETSSDDKHKEDIMKRSMSKTLCKGEPSLSSSSTACLKRRSLETTAARVGGADPSRTKGSRTEQGPWRQRNRGYVVTAMTTNDYYTYNNETMHITA